MLSPPHTITITLLIHPSLVFFHIYFYDVAVFIFLIKTIRNSKNKALTLFLALCFFCFFIILFYFFGFL